MQKLQKLRKLHQNLDQAQNIREMMEFVLKGDQGDEEIFEYFQEQNILECLYAQLIQDQKMAATIIDNLALLIGNIQKPLNLNYVLSNPALQKFINFKYVLTEEVIEYYVTFLKGIAIRITEENIQLYYNQRYSEFPLLWQAQKFIEHPDHMVRTTVQNIILAITKLTHKVMEQPTQSMIRSRDDQIEYLKWYLKDSPFNKVWSKYAIQLYRSFLALNGAMRDPSKDQYLEAISDYISFFCDLYNQCEFLHDLLTKNLLYYVVNRIIKEGLISDDKKSPLGVDWSLYCLSKMMKELLPIKSQIVRRLWENQIYDGELHKSDKDLSGDSQQLDQALIQQFENGFKKQFLYEQDEQVIENMLTKVYILNQQAADPVQMIISNPAKKQLKTYFMTKDDTLLRILISLLSLIPNLDQDTYLQVLSLMECTEFDEYQFTTRLYDHIAKFIRIPALKNNIIEMAFRMKTKIRLFKDQIPILAVNWHHLQQIGEEVELDIGYSEIHDEKVNSFKFMYKYYLLMNILSKFEPQQVKDQLSQNDMVFDMNQDGKLIFIGPYYLNIFRNNSKGQQTIIRSYPVCTIEDEYENGFTVLKCHRLALHQFDSIRFKLSEPHWRMLSGLLMNSKKYLYTNIETSIRSLI